MQYFAIGKACFIQLIKNSINHRFNSDDQQLAGMHTLSPCLETSIEEPQHQNKLRESMLLFALLPKTCVQFVLIDEINQVQDFTSAHRSAHGYKHFHQQTN